MSSTHRKRLCRLAIGILLSAVVSAHAEPAPASVDDIARYYYFDYPRLEGRGVFPMLADELFSGYGLSFSANMFNIFDDISFTYDLGLTDLLVGPLRLGVGVEFGGGNFLADPFTSDDVFTTGGDPRTPDGFSFYQNSEWQRVYSVSPQGGGFPGLFGLRGEVGWRSWGKLSFLYRTQNYSSIDPAGQVQDFSDTVYDWGLEFRPRSIFSSTSPFLPRIVTIRAMQRDGQLDGYAGAVRTPDIPILEALSFGRSNVLDRYFGAIYAVAPNRYFSGTVHLVTDAPVIHAAEAGANLAAILFPDDIQRLSSDGVVIDWNVGVRYEQYASWQQELFLAPEQHVSLLFQFRAFYTNGIVAGLQASPINLFSAFSEDPTPRLLPLGNDVFLGMYLY
ncbi:MAG: hypothetical protein EA383_16260 [Spirochaetaceae bacterium]|nr:MAG: hypothetical protein EA383_16260 [Spirochaetaceae bacterium]